jgi:AcrR family transcriptional regulator
VARPRTLDAGRICRAAAALLTDLGPESVTVAAVAARAGVSPGSIYNYFRNREHLLAAAAGQPGAGTGWVAPEPGEPHETYLRRLAGAALARFRLLGDAAVVGKECVDLADRLAGRLGADGARAFYLAAAGAVLVGMPPEDDPHLAGVIARSLDR